MFLITNISSYRYKRINYLDNIPIIGDFAISLISFFPGLLILFLGLNFKIAMVLGTSTCGLWSFILEKLEIKIDLFFLPAWIFYMIVSFIISIS